MKSWRLSPSTYCTGMGSISMVLVMMTMSLFVLLFGSSLGEEAGDMIMFMSDAGGIGGGAGGIGCDNCGEECKLKCGTRLFRPCCFHFVRKRNPSLFRNPLVLLNLPRLRHISSSSSSINRGDSQSSTGGGGGGVGGFGGDRRPAIESLMLDPINSSSFRSGEGDDNELLSK